MTYPDFTGEPLADLVSLRGRTAVVTGGARGIGLSIAERMAEAGASVVIADLDGGAAAASAERLVSRWGVDALGVEADVTSTEAVDALAERAEAFRGGLNVWVNNAGIYPSTPLVDVTDEEWSTVLAVTLTGAFNGSRAAARILTEAVDRPGRVIINITSTAGIRGRAGLASYVAAKHGVTGLTRSMAVELGGSGLRVVGIAPSIIDTPGMRERRESAAGVAAESLGSFESSIVQRIPLGRAGVPDDVARLVFYAASDLSSYTTGQILSVDGGLTAS